MKDEPIILTMNFRSIVFLAVFAAVPAFGAGFQAEAGVSYFNFIDGQYERNPPLALSKDEPNRAAPFVAVSHAFTPRLALRLSYQFVNNARATIEHGSPPGSMLPIVVFGHYRDDIHVVGLAPEFNFNLTPRFSFALAPKLNWVASRGMVAYSTTDPLILLVGPQSRSEHGFTAGGAARVQWSLGPRAAVTAGYEYSDLDPSFERKAHIFSAGLAWRF